MDLLRQGTVRALKEKHKIERKIRERYTHTKVFEGEGKYSRGISKSEH
jgi:hypothetical protein